MVCTFLKCLPFQTFISLFHAWYTVWTYIFATNLFPQIWWCMQHRCNVRNFRRFVLGIALAYAGFNANRMLRGAEWWNQIKISQKQADLTVFALDPLGARTPFAPLWIRRCISPVLAFKVYGFTSDFKSWIEVNFNSNFAPHVIIHWSLFMV